MPALCGPVGARPVCASQAITATPAGTRTREIGPPRADPWNIFRRQTSMAVVIRMMRAGAKKRPFYRIVVADSRRQRDGRFVEILGHYDPMAKPFAVKMDEARVKDWIAQGAQPSTQAASLFRKAGIIAAR